MDFSNNKKIMLICKIPNSNNNNSKNAPLSFKNEKKNNIQPTIVCHNI